MTQMINDLIYFKTTEMIEIITNNFRFLLFVL